MPDETMNQTIINYLSRNSDMPDETMNQTMIDYLSQNSNRTDIIYCKNMVDRVIGEIDQIKESVTSEGGPEQKTNFEKIEKETIRLQASLAKRMARP